MNAVDLNNALYPWEKKGNTLEEYIQVCKWIEEDGADGLHVSAGSMFPHPLVPPGGFPADELNWWYGGMMSNGVRGFFPNYTMFHFKMLRPIFLWLWNRTKKDYPVEGVSMEMCREIKKNVKIPVINTGGYPARLADPPRDRGRLLRRRGHRAAADREQRPAARSWPPARTSRSGRARSAIAAWSTRSRIRSACYDRGASRQHDDMVREAMSVFHPPPFPNEPRERSRSASRQHRRAAPHEPEVRGYENAAHSVSPSRSASAGRRCVAIALLVVPWRRATAARPWTRRWPPARRRPTFRTRTNDFFRDMDGGVPMTPAEVKGRNTWIVWTGGNEAFWDWLGEQQLRHVRPAQDAVLVPVLRRAAGRNWRRSRRRTAAGSAARLTLSTSGTARFKYLGPDERARLHARPTAPDEFGLCLDKTERDLARISTRRSTGARPACSGCASIRTRTSTAARDEVEPEQGDASTPTRRTTPTSRSSGRTASGWGARSATSAITRSSRPPIPRTRSSGTSPRRSARSTSGSGASSRPNLDAEQLRLAPDRHRAAGRGRHLASSPPITSTTRAR